MGEKEHLRFTDKVKYILRVSVRTKVGRFGGILPNIWGGFWKGSSMLTFHHVSIIRGRS